MVVINGRVAAISIHALREEGDCVWLLLTDASLLFLSTPSARRATVWLLLTDASLLFLSTPSARRATLLKTLHPDVYAISIHALREEGDVVIF